MVVRRVAIIAACLGLSFGPGAYPALAIKPAAPQRPLLAPPPQSSQDLDAVITALVLKQLNEGENQEECGAPYTELLDHADDPAFAGISPGAKKITVILAAACLIFTPSDRGLALIRRYESVVTEPKPRSIIEHALVKAAVRQSDYPEAARRLIALIDLDPETTASWWPRFVAPIVYGVEDDPELSLALLSRLVRLDWQDQDSLDASRNSWALSYARLVAARGDIAAAREALRHVDSIGVLMDLAQDRRLEALWPEFERKHRFDWTKAAEADLARANAKIKAEPLLLVHVQEAIRALRMLERHDEAIGLARKYQARLEAKTVFEDAEDRANWVLNQLGYALLDVGRDAEGQVVFEQAIAMGESGASSVSQRINWAAMLNDRGRAREALQVLASLEDDRVNPYGEMWAAAERVCANALLDPALAAKQVEAMTATWEDNPAALTRGLLCLDRQDAAAELYVRRLSSATHRGGALDAFRNSRRPPAVPARSAELDRRKQAVLGRPEVASAMEAVGRRLDLPLAGDYWGAL